MELFFAVFLVTTFSCIIISALFGIVLKSSNKRSNYALDDAVEMLQLFSPFIGLLVGLIAAICK